MVHMNTHLAVIDWSRYILKSLRLRPMKGKSPTEWKGCGEQDLDIILVKAPRVPKWTHLDRWLLWFRSLDKQWQLKQYFSASGDPFTRWYTWRRYIWAFSAVYSLCFALVRVKSCCSPHPWCSCQRIPLTWVSISTTMGVSTLFNDRQVHIGVNHLGNQMGSIRYKSLEAASATPFCLSV